MNTLTEVVSEVLQAHPWMLRAIARDAGVSHALLTLIARGQRAATPRTAASIAAALAEWASVYGASSARISRVLTDVVTKGDK